MKVPYIVGHDFNCFATDKPLFADTETCGFYNRIRLVQLYQEGMPHVVLIEWPDPMFLAGQLDRFHTVWHNSHYDITTIQAQTSTRWIPAKFDDTFLLTRLKDFQHDSYSLDECLTRVLGYDPYARQLLDKKVLQKSKWDALKLTPEQMLYAATDVFYMPILWNHVSESQTDFNYKLDMLTTRYCLDLQWNGMPVSKEKLFARYEENQAEIAKLALPINPNSYKQVRDWLGCDGSDALTLLTMKLQGNEKAGKIVDARRLIKQNSFLDKFDTMDDRIYGKFLPSARSGRLTSKDQNLQQIPRKLKLAFEAKPGRALWFADYAQVELRSICAITACRPMEKLFREGVDVHGYTAEMLFGKDWTKDQRQLTKTYNFNLLYGGGINMIIGILIKQAEMLLSEKQANNDRRRWRNLWREVYAWQERGIAAWKKGRHGSTPLGRKYKAKLMTDYLNIENQGCAADVFKLALHYMMPELDALGDVFICNVIHDSFIVEGPDNLEMHAKVSEIIARTMQTAWFEVSGSLAIKDLPMPVNVKVGANWGEIEQDINLKFNYNLEGMHYATI